MSFDVYKYLRPGFIRFRVDPKNIEPADDDSTAFSTGPRGEFRGLRRSGLVFDEPVGATGAAALGSVRSPDSTSRFQRIFQTGESPSSAIITFAINVVGLILLILGALVLVFKGPQGWVEIVLGILLIAGPYVLAAKRRRDQRVRMERERRAREEEERALQEKLGEITRLLDSVEILPDEAGIERLRRDRATHDVPYEALAPRGRQAVMRAAFAGINDSSVTSADLGRRVDALCAALGLAHDDVRSVKQSICRRLAWHLIADDRMTPAMQSHLRNVARDLGLGAADFGAEWSAADEFRRMSSVSFGSLPRKTGPIELRFGEVVHHRSGGMIMKPSEVRPRIDSDVKLEDESWLEDGRGELWVTSKGIKLVGERTVDFDYGELRGIEIDGDHGVLVLSYEERKSVAIQLSDPYFSAAVIDFASEADRPKLFGLGALDRRPTV